MEKNFNAIGHYLKKEFGFKVIKLSLDAGFTCPNRDGSKGLGGCIFCSAAGSGELASNIPDQIALLSKKWPSGKYIAYFQSYTNTYAPIAVLREKFEAVLSHPDVIGIAIATRPDCLSEEVLALLDELNKKTFLWVELGLQTIHEKTAVLINRCYTLDIFDEAMEKLNSLSIKTVVHLIFGLPDETKDEMLASVRYVCGVEAANAPFPFGVKLHLLNVVSGSQMETLYPNYVPFYEMDEYVSLVVDALEYIPPNITIHRLTADAPRELLIAPEWSYRKRTILNKIDKELKRRGSFQGSALF